MESTQGKGSFWKRKTYCIITGASQGIGREISIQFASQVEDGSTFLLLARNVAKLNETKREMENINGNINIFVYSYDFYKPNEMELRTLLNKSLDMFHNKLNDFDVSIIVHNAGSLGDLSEHTCDVNTLDKLTSYFTLNFFSVCLLNSAFLKVFDPDKTNSHCDICIVNITSLCAIKPFPSMAYYCTGKSCREMFFSVMAEENKKYRILNYSPGPVLTDMTDVITSSINNEEIKQMFLTMKKDSTILSTKDTVSKLVKVLERQSFKSGSRIDYYDVKD